MNYIKINSKEVYLEEYGKEHERSIVYFHGGPGAGCLDFRAQAKALGETYHVLIFDQLGCWRSEAIPQNESFGLSDHVQLIDKMREILGIKTWTVLGHSFGGMLACLYAYTYQKNIDAVIYECPSWDIALSFKSVASSLYYPYFQSIKSDEGLSICTKIININYLNRQDILTDHISASSMVKDNKVREYLHGISAEELYSHYQLEDDELRGITTQEQFTEKFKRGGDTGRDKILESGEMFKEYLPFLKEIKKPSLLLVGKYDPACGKDQRDYFKQFSINGKIVEFENSGHFPRIEEPQAYTKAIIDFMDNFAV